MKPIYHDPNARLALALNRLRSLASEYSAEFVESLCDDLSDPAASWSAHRLKLPLRLVNDWPAG